jgi:lipoprotein-anchoring transpeptidase ErfK/SrfK
MIMVFSSVMFSFLHGQFISPVFVVGTETIPLSKTVFKLVQKDGEKIVDLTGKNFIVVSVRELGSDGRFYAVNRNGSVWSSGVIASGAQGYQTPSGIFTIIQKKRYHMSNLYPDHNGTNNMDYMMKFRHDGTALHSGNVNSLSRGCIHMDPKEVLRIYKWADYKTKVVITRHSYMPLAQEDLMAIGYGLAKERK